MKQTTVHEQPPALAPDAGTATLPPRAPSARHVVGSAPRARSLLDVFTATALRCGERIAIDAPDAVLTYGELSQAAGALATRLHSLGIGPGDRVGVRIQSGTAELYVAILGVLTAGAAYVPVDAEDPPARAAELWKRSNVCAVVQGGLELMHLAPSGRSERELTVGDEAWVIFTSGSTGEPKGVAVTHRSAAAFVDAEAQLWTVDVEDRVLAGLSVGFDASCEEIWLAWRHGAALVPAPRALVRAGPELGSWIRERGITVVSTVPTLATMWDESSLSAVRLLILGGEACPEGLAQRLASEREVWNTYGPTEATVVSTAARLAPDAQVTIGWPLSGWECAVLDADDEPVAPGDAGELVICGVGLGRYLDPRLDAERFAAVPSLNWDRAYRTGDVVRETTQGLQFVGRRDDQVKIGGRRIELGELDAALSEVPGVKAAVTAVRESTAGNKLLAGYVVGDVEPATVRRTVAQRLPAGLVPMIVPLRELPRGASGKVDRQALPWPPPASPAEGAEQLCGNSAWVAQRWAEQLGSLTLALDSDFFELGGTSLAAAKLVSALRARFPAVAVADVYSHRRLGQLTARLEQLGELEDTAPVQAASRSRAWAILQLAGVFILQVLAAPQLLLGVLAINHLYGGRVGPQLGWGWLIGGWIVFASVPGHALLLVAARKLLLRGLRPGRYPRHSWLTFKIWLIERLAGTWRLEGLAGTPWAARYARLCGHPVGRGARLSTLPPVASLVTIGEDATVEAEVDLEGWWIEGNELVVGEVRIGARTRVGTMSVLMPGADVGADAELEPGTVVSASVPAGQRWAGSPGRCVGQAGQSWPSDPAPRPQRQRLWKAIYGAGMAIKNVVPLAAAVLGLLAVAAFAPAGATAQGFATEAITIAPLVVLSFMLGYGLLVALLVRAVSPLLRPGWHPDHGATAWALWFTDSLMGGANGVLFALYASVYTRPWLRLLGVRVGKRAEVSVARGVNRLTAFADTSFAADAVAFASARARLGWLHVGPIEVGKGSFLGNGAILEDSTRVGEGSLIGVLTRAPHDTPDATSWLGCPAFELPRRAEPTDPARTTNPSKRLIVARGAAELVRMFLASTLSLVLAALVFDELDRIGARDGVATMAALTPIALITAGVLAVAATIVLKWVLMGRYRPGAHPLWSFFVWRDEIMNTCQEQLAAAWLMGAAQATPLMSVYLRLMGAKVGRDVWCETMTITEFDMVELGDGCAVNRAAIVQTHLFHDRLLRIGPTKLGPSSTLGPISAILPDTVLGEGCSVGALSVVMRGEELPAGTRWHGSPVVAV